VRAPRSGARRTLAELSMPSEPGNERRALGQDHRRGERPAGLRHRGAGPRGEAGGHADPSWLGPFRYEEVELQKVCTNPKLQWSRVGTCWHNASARS
jgi:hypothetical protein